MRRLCLLFLTLFVVAAVRAQSVHWEAGDDGAELQLVFQDCTPENDPQLPRVDGTTFTFTGRAENMSVVNFSMSRSVTYSYRVRAQKSGPVQIPSFSLQTNKGTLRVPAFTGGAPRSASDANIASRLEPGAPSVWAGEVFPLNYVLDVPRRSFNQLGTNIEWSAPPLVVEEWSKFEPSESTVNGEARLAITARTRAYIKAPGPVTLNAANQLVNLQSGSIGFGLFQTPRIEQLSVTSNQPAVVVRPLPPAPAGFTGAVGQFKLASKIVPTNAAVGEPVTWTLELSGTGNWPEIAGLPQREVSRDFNVVQPQAKRTPAEGKLFDVTLTEDVVLVPTHAGSYTLGPVNVVTFDPATGGYKTLTTPSTVVTITAPAPTPTTPAPVVTSGGEPSPATALSKMEHRESKTPPAPAAPLGIPRDPLPGSTRSLVPLADRTLGLLLLAPFCALPLLWAWLALQRARRTDPLRPRRDARQRLAATLAALRTSSSTSNLNSPPPAALLLRWQHDAALLWEIRHAAPAPVAFASSDGGAVPPPRTPPARDEGVAPPPASAWSQLWSEADRALYSASAGLPADWVSRAEAALAAKTVPAFSPLRLFLPRNLLPFVAVLTLLLAFRPSASAQPTPISQLPSPISAAADPAAAYRQGDFAAAEKTWNAALAQNPTDAIAHHNLSLALAQQDRWGEAAAHAAAAFVQHPAAEPLRWQLALACEKAGYAPAPLVGFLPPGPVQSLARLASPGTWQINLLLAALVFAAALATLLIGAYRAPSRPRTLGAFLALAIAALLGLAATTSLRAYGVAADARAVIAWRAGTLRSIPTEADNTQKTTVLPAGSVAIADKTFLGWTRLAFENGQTGWVRQEEVVPLWGTK